jgi:hypothetical protein
MEYEYNLHLNEEKPAPGMRQFCHQSGCRNQILLNASGSPRKRQQCAAIMLDQKGIIATLEG